MPPKVKVTKEGIVSAAVDVVRRSGEQAINARTLATALSCSTQPIFSNFSTMDELRVAVIVKADEIFNKYMETEISSSKYPEYKASGMAYIRFAKEEKELFKLLYMNGRSCLNAPENTELNERMDTIIRNNTGLDGSQMQWFHLEMWTAVHGIATMFATSFLDLEWEVVSKLLTDIYQGLRKQYGME